MATFTLNTTHTFRSVAITTDREGGLKASEPSRGGEVLPDGWTGKCVAIVRGEGMVQIEDGRVLRTDKNKLLGSEQATKYLTKATAAKAAPAMSPADRVAQARKELEEAELALAIAKEERAKLYASLKAEFEAQEAANLEANA